MASEKKKEGRWAKKRRLKKEKESKIPSFKQVGQERLMEMFREGFGQSRSLDKLRGETKNRIYSKQSYITYKNQFRYFSDWVKETHPDVRSIDEARTLVNKYLQYLIDQNRSAYSIATAKASLSKVFQTDATQFIATPIRRRADVQRSRFSVERDKHISDELEQKLSQFTSATGLRRKEMLQIEAESLFFKDGRAYLNVVNGTKNGKPRVAEIMGVSEAETKMIVEFIQSKKGRLFPKLSPHYDNHYYRGIYAKRIYSFYARKENDIPKSEKYVMRKDRAGEVLDKLAMKITSKMLGHERINVIAQSYLY
ncbi:hypothetical protein B7693_00095 [Streptococcus mitis]|uniref:Integrase catalytic domain-containing protein n=1 Tax=Streptococcus mitis TaxID=28037 RepID=A0A1X1L0M2_STRMT|nr:integrase domain-containing protein [Streptococcus mitis]ORP05124.1 hypothetical protein B7693_00095 [Streptococcus mitis]